METIIKKYQNKTVEDWGSMMSYEARKFALDFQRRLKHNAKNRNMEVVNFNINHYDFSGFLKRGDKYVYFSYDIPRHEEPINLYSRSCRSGFLIRTAKHPKDYKGGYNNFCNLIQFFDSVEYLLDR